MLHSLLCYIQGREGGRERERGSARLQISCGQPWEAKGSMLVGAIPWCLWLNTTRYKSPRNISATSTILPCVCWCLLCINMSCCSRACLMDQPPKSLWLNLFAKAKAKAILGDSWWNQGFYQQHRQIPVIPGLCSTFAGYFIYYFSLSELCVSQGSTHVST